VLINLVKFLLQAELFKYLKLKIIEDIEKIVYDLMAIYFQISRI